MDTNSSFVLQMQPCQRLALADIELATHNFDEALVIGCGGFGKVYRSLSKFGSVSDVAIKRLDYSSTQGSREFEAEVQVLSNLRHGNLVPLIGYCYEGKEMVLAYEFMPNGSLKDHLQKDDTELSWLQRLKICIGAARGLDYLHTGTSTQHGVIHRDVKTSNILLDSNFEAKISDFGLAKIGTINQTKTYVSTVVKGTFGYMDPSYCYSGKLTRKTDVYAFGVVLFEVLTGRKALDETLDEEQCNLAVWAQDHIKNGKINDIIDCRLMGQISKKCLKEFASIAVHCLNIQPKQRSTMAEVVVKLVSILTQERERADSGLYEGRFINKVRYFFTGRSDLMRADHIQKSNHQNLKTSLYAELLSANDFKHEEHLTGRSDLMLADHIQKSNNQSLKAFTYAELLSATKDFKHVEHSTTLHETIYKGWLDETTYAPTECGIGLVIYVRKRQIGTLKPDIKPEEFNHPHLGKLLGYCLNGEELSCVYKPIPDTSLDKLLFGELGTTSLSWVARLKIAVGAAEGLSFLHQKNRPAYSQFKTTCISVDKDYNAWLSYFEVENSFVARDSYSFGLDAHYAAPEWFRYQADIKLDGNAYQCEDGFGVKSEIYAFGVVLLEILTGMKVFDWNRPEGKQNLVKWATPLLAHEINVGNILDPKLQDNNHPPKGAFRLALLVSKCLQPTEEERPSMDEILQVLRQCYLEETNTSFTSK